MSVETLLHFTISFDTTASGVACMLTSGLGQAGIPCNRPTPIDSAVRFVARVDRARVPVLVGEATGSDRYIVSIGSSLMPVARLIGTKDADHRDGVIQTLRSILEATPEVTVIEFHDGDGPPDG